MRKYRPSERETQLAELLLQLQQAIVNSEHPATPQSDGGHQESVSSEDSERPLGFSDAQAAAREALRALARDVELPKAIDVTALEKACKRIAYDPWFVYMPSWDAEVEIIAHASLILTDPKRRDRGRLPSGKERPSRTPPCPPGVGANTHERLWQALPQEEWFRTGDLKANAGIELSETTVRLWCQAMKPRYLEHNGYMGKGSLYRRRPK